MAYYPFLEERHDLIWRPNPIHRPTFDPAELKGIYNIKKIKKHKKIKTMEDKKYHNCIKSCIGVNDRFCK